MSCVTIAAFFLAVALTHRSSYSRSARRISYSILLSTGQDNPLGIFGYIALLNIGVAAVVLRKRWDHLLLLAAVGAVSMELLWCQQLLPCPESCDRIRDLPRLRITIPACLFSPSQKCRARKMGGMGRSHLRICFVRLRRLHPERLSRAFAKSGFAFRFHLRRGPRPGCPRDRIRPLLVAEIAGVAVFGLLAGWTAGYLDAALLWYGLGSYVLFAVLHAGALV